MSRFQKLMRLILPKQLFQKMEAESKAWMVTCDCGYSRSVWDIGGMRYKSKDNNKTYGKCPSCGQMKWLQLVKNG